MILVVPSKAEKNKKESFALKVEGLSDFKIDIEKAGYTPVGSVSHNLKTMNELKNKNVEVTFFVAGNCGMCKARIEEASLAINGVRTANWDVNSKILSVSFDASKTTKTNIEKHVAKVGHDTKEIKSDDATYNDLPACCKYDRVD